ncbi:hypothetical protein M407DRAFT_33062 [Tulasnella calospora MUT 4182]|uniref:non-specific serine/threonine protein kinase n=1 Tax=Tulasnella calospora MUT 4182 TaxID=1051891 RepID=A0A0C3PRL6_9AGAM|nr:hypothetical protein M407DRAFT_33062 [Tulasnella calospora MUT 4182]
MNGEHVAEATLRDTAGPSTHSSRAATLPDPNGGTSDIAGPAQLLFDLHRFSATTSLQTTAVCEMISDPQLHLARRPVPIYTRETELTKMKPEGQPEDRKDASAKAIPGIYWAPTGTDAGRNEAGVVRVCLDGWNLFSVEDGLKRAYSEFARASERYLERRPASSVMERLSSEPFALSGATTPVIHFPAPQSRPFLTPFRKPLTHVPLPTAFVFNDQMDLSGLSIVDSGPSEPFGGTSQLNPKLGTPEFVGGHATVSRALLTPASATEGNVNKLENGEVGLKSSDKNVMRKDVAVKKLKIENKDDRERVLKLALREAGFLTELNHGRIIKLEGFAVELANDRIWLIFLWHEHGNLKDFVASQDWEIPERICLIDDVTCGVEYLHSQDPPICHGDLRSINVLVTSRCRAVITDFGSARRLSKTVADMQTTRTEKKAEPAPEFQATFCATTGTMTFTGNEYTLRWAAPELLMDEKPGLSSDIWALGWICY